MCMYGPHASHQCWTRLASAASLPLSPKTNNPADPTSVTVCKQASRTLLGPMSLQQQNPTPLTAHPCPRACSMAQDLTEQLKPRSSPAAPRQPARKLPGRADTIKPTQGEQRRWGRQASYLRQVCLTPRVQCAMASDLAPSRQRVPLISSSGTFGTWHSQQGRMWQGAHPAQPAQLDTGGQAAACFFGRSRLARLLTVDRPLHMGCSVDEGGGGGWGAVRQACCVAALSGSHLTPEGHQWASSYGRRAASPT